MNEQTYYLVESSGPQRQVWRAKSRTLAGAKREAGARHIVMQGAFRAGETLADGVLQAKVRAGAVWTAEAGVMV